MCVFVCVCVCVCVYVCVCVCVCVWVGGFVGVKNIKIWLLGDLYFAGMETTIHSLRWLALMLMLYPEEQVKIFNEINEVIVERSVSLKGRRS